MSPHLQADAHLAFAVASQLPALASRLRRAPWWPAGSAEPTHPLADAAPGRRATDSPCKNSWPRTARRPPRLGPPLASAPRAPHDTHAFALRPGRAWHGRSTSGTPPRVHGLGSACFPLACTSMGIPRARFGSACFPLARTAIGLDPRPRPRLRLLLVCTHGDWPRPSSSASAPPPPASRWHARRLGLDPRPRPRLRLLPVGTHGDWPRPSSSTSAPPASPCMHDAIRGTDGGSRVHEGHVVEKGAGQSAHSRAGSRRERQGGGAAGHLPPRRRRVAQPTHSGGAGTAAWGSWHDLLRRALSEPRGGGCPAEKPPPGHIPASCKAQRAPQRRATSELPASCNAASSQRHATSKHRERPASRKHPRAPRAGEIP
jgi:hypothetical protein